MQEIICILELTFNYYILYCQQVSKQKDDLQRTQLPRNIICFDKQLLLVTIKMQLGSRHTHPVTSTTASTTAAHPQEGFEAPPEKSKCFFHGLFLLVNLKSKVTTQCNSNHRDTREHTYRHTGTESNKWFSVNPPTSSGKVNSGTALNQTTLFSITHGMLTVINTQIPQCFNRLSVN